MNKEEVNGLNIQEKIAMGKDIVKMMSLEREKLTQESQVLRDRIEI